MLEQIKRIGSLTDINQAIRLITNLGYTVIGWDELIVDVLDVGTIAFVEIDGRIRLA